MALPEPLLDTTKLLEQLRELGAIGHDAAQGGRTRIALTDEEKAGRDLLVRWMRELDLEVRVDQIGNIFGVLHADHPQGMAQPLMMGSHIDTVRNAGALDGCYGVLAGLAVVRAYRQAGLRPARAIVVAAFTNEEGVRYQPDMMGSLVYAGGMDVQAALHTVGTDGTRLGDELARIGYAGDMAPGAIVPREYIELHIEQVGALVFGFHFHDHRQVVAQCARAQLCREFFDHPRAFQQLESAVDRRGREVGPLAQFALGHAPIALQGRQQRAVVVVQLHRGRFRCQC